MASDFLIKQVANAIGNSIGDAIWGGVASSAVSLTVAGAEFANLVNNIADGTATTADVMAVTVALEGAIVGAGLTVTEACLVAGMGLGVGISSPQSYRPSSC